MKLVAIIAILSILCLEIIALANGINGASLAGACALISGLGGYAATKLRKPK